ncbi:katanin p60 ATPase-containing subunit A-like 2 isoform X1 [Homarus americanus]|uniref:katanin p60 ATPase-containing subunit A-like 2 isoform X1 n=1 Tax=Homarus americanus TaxID=6706 RepID=UPI001C44FD63|nr:katanin p60 ATPase-containing subunit A-like 2 isoform X1 [Homarus americanus]XP_042210940.1 katanin p60 ATPase-containing subunit A-like 2 isoform X1 [Homarus americanus]
MRDVIQSPVSSVLTGGQPSQGAALPPQRGGGGGVGTCAGDGGAGGPGGGTGGDIHMLLPALLLPPCQADKRAEIRRKSLIILVHHYLDQEGYGDAAKTLVQEARLNTDQFTVCDSVDLSNILQEYESWFVVKYQRYPKLAKRMLVPRPTPKPHRCGHTDDDTNNGKQETLTGKKSPFFRRRSLPRHGGSGGSMGRAASDPSLSDDVCSTTEGGRGHGRSRNSVRNKIIDNKKREELGRGPLVGRRVSGGGALRSPGDEKKDPSKSSSDTDSERGGAAATLGPVKTNRMPRQVLDLKQMISDYTRLEDNVGDVGKGPPRTPGNPDQPPGEEDEDTGLWDEKSVKPLLMPHFTGEFRDLANIIQREILVENPEVRWTDILGLEDAKRLVKEAVVYPLKYPQLFVGRFKPWRGILLYGPPGTGKTLLAKAVATECNTTFFNISATSLVSKWRGDSEKLVRVLFEMARFHAPSTIFVDEVDALMASRQGEQEHEASRRMKTQLLVELDGLTQANHHVFLLAASNIPWQLDPAMLRRLEKRILVPLPGMEAREAMFRHHLPEVISDLEEAGHAITTHLDYEKLAQMSEGYSGSDLQVVCREAAMGCLRKVFNVLEDHSVEDSELPDLKLDSIKMCDVESALQKTKPAQGNNEQYTEWHSKYGSA